MTAPRPLGTAADALALLARLLPLATRGDERGLADALAAGARDLLAMPGAAVVATGDRGSDPLSLALPGHEWALTLPEPVEGEARKLAQAIVAAGGAAFEQLERLKEERRRAKLQEALAGAAQALQASLDLSDLLARVCREAAGIAGAGAAAFLRLDGEELVVEGLHGMGPELIGWRMPAGAGLAGRALQEGRTVSTQDHRAEVELAPDSPWSDARAVIAVPVDWDGGRLRGVLAGVHLAPATVALAHEEALTAFADLAGTAFANATAHTGLALSLRVDPLTGCLNHAALHDGLRREVERAERAGGAVLSLVLLDLRDTTEDELADEVLRRAGHSLRATTRPYDLAARYGGAEFALVTVEADEQQACEVAARAVARLTAALADVGGGGATAGVAQWHPGMTAGDLVARADRALTYGRRSGRRGEVLTEADLPPTFLPGRGRRRERRLPTAPATPIWSPAAGDALEPLRARTRKLAQATQLGARLAELAGGDEIRAAATEAVGELFACARVTIGPTRPATTGSLDVSIAPWGELRVELEDEPEEGDERLLETIAAHLAAALTAAARRETLERACVAAASALTDAPSALAGRAVEAGRRLGLDKPALEELALAALLAEAGDRAAGDANDPAPSAERNTIEAAQALLAATRAPWSTIPLAARILAASLAHPDELAADRATRFDPAVAEALKGVSRA